MSEKYTLKLEPRAVLGKKVNRLRRAGLLPATVYGKGVGPLSVQLDARGFQDVYRRAGRSSLIELLMEGQAPLAAFVHTLQRHPISRAIIHVDFHAVDLLQEVQMSVPLHATGESPLAARGDAIINLVLNTIEIRALPTAIPGHISVDVSNLDSFDKDIYVRDLELPAGVTLVTSGDELAVNLAPTRAAVAEESETEAIPAEPELVRERRESEE